MKLHRVLLLAVLFLFPVMAYGQSFTGNLTASGTTCGTTNACIAAPIVSQGGATFTLSGTFSGTVQFEASGDGGTTWVALSVTPSNSATTVTSATGAGTWQANVAAYTGIRIRCSTYSSGTIVATITLSNNSARTNGGSSSGSGVSSFNTRTGTVTLSQADVTAVGALSDPSVFNCSTGGPYANLNACLDAAKTYVTTNESGSGLAAQIFIPQGTYSLTAPYTLRGGMQIYGVMPRMEYVSGTPPDLSMIYNGGTVINCGAAATCFTGSNLRGVWLKDLGFTNYTGYAVDWGADSTEGAAFCNLENIYAIGGTSVNATTGGFRIFNFADVQGDRLFAFNVNTGLNLTQQSSVSNYGNSTFNDIYIHPYAKSAANSNNTTSGLVVQVLNPSSGTAANFNNITFNRLHVQEPSGGDNTAKEILIQGYNNGTQVNALSIRDMDIEGSDAYGLYLNGYVQNSQFDFVQAVTNTYDIGYIANVNNNDFTCSINCKIAPLPGTYTANRFWGLFDTLPTFNASAMFGTFETFQDSLFHVYAAPQPIIGFGTNNINLMGAIPTATTGYAQVAIGAGALAADTSGFENMAIGAFALQANTTAFNNTAIGVSALSTEATSSHNTAIGASALAAQTSSGFSNTAIGEYAGLSVTAGGNDVFIGDDAGGNTTTGTNDIAIGSSTTTNAVGDTNEIVIGTSVAGNGSNSTTLGNSSTAKFIPYGTVFVEGTAPTVASNAGSGSLTHGTNNSGVIATGTASTTSTLTFATGKWSTWVSCAVNASIATAQPYVSAISTTSATFTYVTTGTPTLYYRCDGQ